MLKSGVYVSENTGYYLYEYRIQMRVKETKDTYVFELQSLVSRYAADHIKNMFKDSNKCIIRKQCSVHAMNIWSSDDFTLYPYQAGIPYWFQRISD